MNAHVTYFAVTGEQLDELLKKAIKEAQPKLIQYPPSPVTLNLQGLAERYGCSTSKLRRIMQDNPDAGLGSNLYQLYTVANWDKHMIGDQDAAKPSK